MRYYRLFEIARRAASVLRHSGGTFNYKLNQTFIVRIINVFGFVLTIDRYISLTVYIAYGECYI